MIAVHRQDSDKYFVLYNTETRKENEVSDDSSEIDLTRKVSTTEQRISSLFADETCRKPYNELSRTARITCETTLANAILTTVVSKQQIADHGYDYILDNRKKIARSISQLLDVTKVHLERIIKYDIVTNKKQQILYLNYNNQASTLN